MRHPSIGSVKGLTIAESRPSGPPEYRTADCHRLQIERWTVGNRLVAKPLKSPQLPCYSQVIADVETIAIGQVSINEPGYLTLGTGIGLDDADKKNKKAKDRAGVIELADLKDQWLADLRSLVRAFVDGSGTPTPSPNACRYCHYAVVCRAHVVCDWDAEEALSVSDAAVRHEV